jgi:signal transduction histidine kinase
MLHEFLTEQRDELIVRCQAKVALRRSPQKSETDADHGVPLFLDQLIDTLRLELASSPYIGESATKHGNELLRRGFTVDQVVHDYGDVCQTVTELAIERNAPITIEEFRILNRCLDEAIADAVTEYGRQHNQFVSDEHSEHLGVLAHELRNLINAAGLAYAALSSGHVGIGGSTGAVLGHCLQDMRKLVDRSITNVRLDAKLYTRERVEMVDFIEEARVSATLEARSREIDLMVHAVEDGLAVEADRQILASVLANLLQNAFKFSRPGSTVTVKTRVIADRVLIQIEDECGGLPPGEAENMFRPFVQRGTDRTGLGLGLGICLRGIEANGGRLHVHDVPGRGCVFTIDMPRQLSRSPAS